MKQFLTLFVAVLLFTMGCNSPQTKTEDASTTIARDTTKAIFTPYKARMINLTVKDFDTWFTMFKTKDSLFKSYGLTQPGVGRELDNDKKVIVFCNMADEQKAKDYTNSPARKEALQKSGVTNASDPTYWNVIMDDTSKIPQHERLMVVHHVKDFDAWKKVYDGEGTAGRKANGFYERAMARKIDDPNTVCLIFAITDMQKLKARMDSPEFKKLMADAGVDSAPQITYFKWVND